MPEWAWYLKGYLLKALKELPQYTSTKYCPPFKNASRIQHKGRHSFPSNSSWFYLFNSMYPHKALLKVSQTTTDVYPIILIRTNERLWGLEKLTLWLSCTYIFRCCNSTVMKKTEKEMKCDFQKFIQKYIFIKFWICWKSNLELSSM